MVKLKTKEDIDGIRKSGQILAGILQTLKKEVGEGVTLAQLNKLASSLLEKAGAKSAFFGYKPDGAKKAYPAYICTSLNDIVVHGIPTNRALVSGDVLKIDFGVDFGGYIADAAFTTAIGTVSAETSRLINTTRQALIEAVQVCRPGARLGDIGWAIEKTVRDAGFHVIRNLTGHGVGFELHEDPVIYNYGERGTGLKLQEGMVLALEPMASLSSNRAERCDDDSYVTDDRSVSAHFEATVAVVRGEVEILMPLDFLSDL